MPPLLPHILHTKIVTFVIFPATTSPREIPVSAALVNRQTKKDPLAPSQKVLRRHKKSASTIDAQLPFEKV
jgi:hypothetical protein